MYRVRGYPRMNRKKAVQFFQFSILRYGVVLEKSPVHLSLQPRHCLKPHRCLLIQMLLLIAHIFPHNAVTALEALFPYLLQYPLRRARRFLQPYRYLLLVWVQLQRLRRAQAVYRPRLALSIFLGRPRVKVVLAGYFCVAQSFLPVVSDFHPDCSFHFDTLSACRLTDRFECTILHFSPMQTYIF